MKMPTAWVTASPKEPKSKVQARIDMSAEIAGAGLCPECKGPMEQAVVNGHPVLACHVDRIVLPIKDDDNAV